MKRLILAITSTALLLLILLPIHTNAQFDPLGQVCDTTSTATVCRDKAAGVGQNTSSNKIYGADGIFTKAVNIVSILIGIAAVIMMLIGGFKYITAGGDANQVKNARRTVIFAAVGVLTALFAQGMILFVFNKL